MSNIGPENPPAFPHSRLGSDADGMTLRDYFAAMAMQAYLGWSDASSHGEAIIADCAYAMADAMLAERSKT
jgi:hypothetical protein